MLVMLKQNPSFRSNFKSCRFKCVDFCQEPVQVLKVTELGKVISGDLNHHISFLLDLGHDHCDLVLTTLGISSCFSPMTISPLFTERGEKPSVFAKF